jgi:AraC family transcriptional regulator
MVVESFGEMLVSKADGTRSHEWMRRVMTLLTAAVGQLHDQEHPAHRTLLEAASLLRRQIDPEVAGEVADSQARLLAWQARKVRNYIDGHIAGRILVADLSAVIQLSEAHFSRAFKRTFGESPHAFVIRRRVEFAAHYLLQADASLRDIALQCGFSDQSHLCKAFRQATGQSPALWRRMRRTRSAREEAHRGVLDCERLQTTGGATVVAVTEAQSTLAAAEKTPAQLESAIVRIESRHTPRSAG